MDEGWPLLRADGGPADGLELPAQAGEFVWFDHEGYWHEQPNDSDAGLYFAEGDRLRYMGPNAYECDGCQAIVGQSYDDGTSPERCPLCGAGKPRGRLRMG